MSKPSLSPFDMDPGDIIVSAWCEYNLKGEAENAIIYVVIRDTRDNLRIETILPKEQTLAELWQFNIQAAAHASLLNAISAHLRDLKLARKEEPKCPLLNQANAITQHHVAPI